MSLKNKLKDIKLFNNMFGFESGVDITNDNQVLYRKNVVIKNIIFVSNLIYTLIFTIISFGEKSNWLLTILMFPATFLVNHALKKTINKDPDDYMSQTIAMYLASFYMFLSSIIIYFKLKNGSLVFLQECGYILLYYSLAVVAFYQNKKMLKVVCQWVMVLVTILHFTVTYNVLFSEEATDIKLFIETFLLSDAFKDIIIRTILLAVFMLVLYSSVAMSGYMQEERKKELIKRREVQEDFTNVVTKIFDVTLDNSSKSSEDIHNIMVVSKMSNKLAVLLGMNEEEACKISDFAKIHIEEKVQFNPLDKLDEDAKFLYLRSQTSLGSIIISRLQLERKCEEIIRATFEGSNNDDFIHRMKNIQNEIASQIILICDLYVTMRSIKSYKKAYNHKLTFQYMTEQFKSYFDITIFERFTRFGDEFEKIYDES